jgi:hypothetical protein
LYDFLLISRKPWVSSLILLFISGRHYLGCESAHFFTATSMCQLDKEVGRTNTQESKIPTYEWTRADGITSGKTLTLLLVVKCNSEIKSITLFTARNYATTCRIMRYNNLNFIILCI